MLTKRHDFTHGYSCYYIYKNIKVSKFLNDKDELVYWYCDIIDTYKDSEKYIFNDLLADVIIYPDGSYKVVDIDEIAECEEKGILTKEMIIKLMRSLDGLLKDIYSGKFQEYKAYIEGFEEKERNK